MENLRLNRNIKLYKRQLKVIPIFFATDDNYAPFLEVALRSLIENASKNFKYNIHILNTGLSDISKTSLSALADQNFNIIFEDISDKIEPIKARLKNVYHFSLVTYYRLFIESLFPQYDKVLYLDCDIVVLGDISKLYNTMLGNNLVGAITDQVISGDEVFRRYASLGVGVEPKKYFNAGILVMNLKKFRAEKIEEKFVYLMNTYNFDVCDPDQAYLNALCKDRVKYLPNGWNKEPFPTQTEGKLNIAHYALYKKPWQYDDVINGEYFWHYAKQCNLYDKILETRDSFDDVKRRQKEESNIAIAEHATRIANADNNMRKVLFEKENLLDKVFGERLSVLFEDDMDGVEI